MNESTLPARNVPARYYMVGGFLGAGKTTAVAALAHRLVSEGQRVGLITNDQGTELVDTAMLRARGFATEEISGGCFCCRFNSLVDAAKKLDAASRPDALVAEPVGSCTDLVATVTYPLRRIYGDQFQVAPLSVLVDPVRAEQVLGLAPARKFSDKVLYIWRKQAEEADALVLSKVDLLEDDGSRRRRLLDRLAVEFPNKPIFEISARTGGGVEKWFRYLFEGRPVSRPVMVMDYDLYAEGEALLGWLNATVEIEATEPFDGNELLRRFADDLRQRLSGAEIAHLKMTFSPRDGLGDIAAVSLVRSDYIPELSLSLEDPVFAGQLIVNLRAEADPARLRSELLSAVAHMSVPSTSGELRAAMEHVECFRPGRPSPTHRVTQAELDATPLP